MNGAELKVAVYDLKLTVGTNCRYYQTLEARYGWWDKAIKIAVGSVAVVGFGLAFKDYPPAGIIVGGLSIAVATALNIVPVGDWEKRSGELFRLWSDLYKDASVFHFRWSCLPDDEKVTQAIAEQMYDLRSKECQLHSMDPAPDRALLEISQGDEIESVYGAGIRTTEQADEKVRKAIEQVVTISPSAA